jgi:hypothetical protein
MIIKTLKRAPHLTTFHAVTPVLLPTALAGSASEAIRTKLTTKPVVKIEKGDFSRKVEQAREFLSKGHNLRLAIVLVTLFPQGEQRAEFLYREFVTSIEDLIVEIRAKGLTQDGALRTADFQSNCTKEGN